jgi:hypothetical protein
VIEYSNEASALADIFILHTEKKSKEKISKNKNNEKYFQRSFSKIE